MIEQNVEFKKTIDNIDDNSFKLVHDTLRNITGEDYLTFKERFMILHTIATTSTNSKLKLDEISNLCELSLNDIGKHLNSMKAGNLLDNKGGRSWRITPTGRRLLDNLTIQLFETNESFDSLKILLASQTHLSKLAELYGVDLNIKKQILRFFLDILSEIEDTDLNLLSPYEIKELNSLLKNSEVFYQEIRSKLMDNNSYEDSYDMYLVFNSLTKRHKIIGETMTKLNNRIYNLAENINLEEALDLYLKKLTKEKAQSLVSKYKFINKSILEIINSKETIQNYKSFILKEKIIPPDYNNFKIKKVEVIEDDVDIKDEEKELFKIIQKSQDTHVKDLVNIANWKQTTEVLNLLHQLAYKNKIDFINLKDLYFLDKEVYMIRDSKIIIKNE